MATKKNTAVTIDGKEYEYYRITRTVGHKYKDGKKIPIKKQFYGTSKGDSERQYKEYLKAQAEAKYAEEKKTEGASLKLFSEYAEEFTYTVLPYLPHYAPGTKELYERNYRVHIKNTNIAGMPIGEVSTKDIQDLYQSLDITKQTLQSVHKWMAAFYKWVVVNDYASNVLSAVTMPAKRDGSRHEDIIVWEQEEIQKIFRHAEQEDHRLLFLFKVLFYTGIRISEALGLKYDDIKNGFIHIDRQYERGIICPPKHNSYRSVPVHSEILKALEWHREWHRKEMDLKKYSTEYIFTTNSGRFLDYHNIRRSMIRLYKRYDIPEKKIHAYRATFCTELCRANVPVEVASKLMGHKSVEVTARHYALIREDVKLNAINQLPTL